jgi:hypothetical protein
MRLCQDAYFLGSRCNARVFVLVPTNKGRKVSPHNFRPFPLALSFGRNYNSCHRVHVHENPFRHVHAWPPPDIFLTHEQPGLLAAFSLRTTPKKKRRRMYCLPRAVAPFSPPPPARQGPATLPNTLSYRLHHRRSLSLSSLSVVCGSKFSSVGGGVSVLRSKLLLDRLGGDASQRRILRSLRTGPSLLSAR